MAIELLTGLGFIVNVKKSILVPTQELDFLGFCLNSQDMTTLPQSKLQSLKNMATEMMGRQKTTVRELACLLGMVASHPTVLPAPLYYRHLERAKTRALQNDLSYKTDTNRWELKVRPTVMGSLSKPQQRTNIADYSLGTEDQIRCIPNGAGSQLSRKFHRRALDGSGEKSPHYLSRVAGCVSGLTMLCH